LPGLVLGDRGASSPDYAMTYRRRSGWGTVRIGECRRRRADRPDGDAAAAPIKNEDVIPTRRSCRGGAQLQLLRTRGGAHPHTRGSGIGTSPLAQVEGMLLLAAGRTPRGPPRAAAVRRQLDSRGASASTTELNVLLRPTRAPMAGAVHGDPPQRAGTSHEHGRAD